ncbi:MAG: Protein translocase subunit SecA [Alphaproteobacteria bacterium MarineAlpha9_Bin4]|nr:preprotein translocase subunit SecA [Pelagibacterales bacterium]PPR25782.1 MAG: Protein translocase subunit SecA [Alphaproteobacteria bacterium MarineAlpha9_Bin4]
MYSFIKNNFFLSHNQKTLNNYKKLLEKVNYQEEVVKKLSDSEFKQNTQLLKEMIIKGKSLDSILPQAFAAVREAAIRTLNQRHYDVQILGGITLHNGKIAEMKTGEGKTLVSTLAAYLNALSGKGVHVVTVNDYLAKRDSQWMGNIYSFLGLSVGYIFSGMPESERKKAYESDITYGTNNEFGFDYLKDNMKFNPQEISQRDFNYAIIDEVDSILIDEARTPLIISGPVEDNTDFYRKINSFVKNLSSENFEIDEKSKSINLNSIGIEYFEKTLLERNIIKNENLYSPDNINVLHFINQCLKANFLFHKDKDYLVKDNQVIIVDEFTGRMMEGRRYSEGLHQAIEAKENVIIQNENQTLASITFQNYFRMYPKLAGMTGTAKTEAAEFSEIYSLDVVQMPTHKNMIRLDNNDEIYRTREEKWNAICKEVSKVHSAGQPILVGTTNISTSELISKKLRKLKIKHQVLNARYHEKEANIISQAGKPYAVTIATNMAGRGTDIQLGGNYEEKKINNDKQLEKINFNKNRVMENGGLYVVGTERHESRRIDNQLRGRSGRQGDPGSSKFFISLEDDLMRIFGSERLDSILKTLGLKEGEAIIHPWISKAIEKAQSKVENKNFEIRKNLLKFDDVMNDQRSVIYSQRKDILNTKSSYDFFLEIMEETVSNIIEFSVIDEQDEENHKKKITSELKNNLGLLIKNIRSNDKESIKKEIIQNIKHILENKISQIGIDNFNFILKQLIIQVLDQQWKQHLLSLDNLRQGIGLRAYAQRDPLNEYKREAFSMFENMLDSIRVTVTRLIILIEFKDENATEKKKSSNYRERLRKRT